MDINNDGGEDIVTVFTDGSVIWSKQYGGKDLFIDMGPLLQIYGDIDDVFVLRNKNGFDSLAVSNRRKNTLTAYVNNLGAFEVNGRPICIDTRATGEKAHHLNEIDQRFIEDMDNDGNSDIIINQ